MYWVTIKVNSGTFFDTPQKGGLTVKWNIPDFMLKIFITLIQAEIQYSHHAYRRMEHEIQGKPETLGNAQKSSSYHLPLIFCNNCR